MTVKRQVGSFLQILTSLADILSMPHEVFSFIEFMAFFMSSCVAGWNRNPIWKYLLTTDLCTDGLFFLQQQLKSYYVLCYFTRFLQSFDVSQKLLQVFCVRVTFFHSFIMYNLPQCFSFVIDVWVFPVTSNFQNLKLNS